MNASPLVSVILTSFNYRKYVAESLESVFRQTYTNLELIVVDDGSTDGSRELIDDLVRQAPIKTKKVYKTNGGQGSAINQGLNEATGEVIALLDSDDYWYPEKVSRMVELVTKNPDGGIYQHQLDTPYGKKRNSVMSADVFLLWKEWGKGILNIPDDHATLCFSPFLPTSALLFRREVFDRITPIPAGLRTCPDAFLSRTSVVHGPLYSCPTSLGFWRDHGENMTHRNEFGFRDFWLPHVLPELNSFYRNMNAGLQLVYEPELRSRVSLGRLFGQGAPSIDDVLPSGAIRETCVVSETGCYALEFEVAPTTERTIRIDTAVNGKKMPTLTVECSQGAWKQVRTNHDWILTNGCADIWISPSSLAHFRSIRLNRVKPTRNVQSVLKTMKRAFSFDRRGH